MSIFRDFKPDQVSKMNPEFADVGIYRFNNDELTVKQFMRTIQGSGWSVSKSSLQENQDKLFFESKDYTEKYVPLEIPESSLINTPDW